MNTTTTRVRAAFSRPTIEKDKLENQKRILEGLQQLSALSAGNQELCNILDTAVETIEIDDNDTLFGNELRLKIEGTLDAQTTPDVQPVFDEVVARKPDRVTINLKALTLIDSLGVRAIVALFKRVKADGGQLVIVHAQNQPLTVLKLLKLDRILGPSEKQL